MSQHSSDVPMLANFSIGSANVWMCFGFAPYFELSKFALNARTFILVMSTPVNQLTVDQSHNEFNSL